MKDATKESANRAAMHTGRSRLLPKNHDQSFIIFLPSSNDLSVLARVIVLGEFNIPNDVALLPEITLSSPVLKHVKVIAERCLKAENSAVSLEQF